MGHCTSAAEVLVQGWNKTNARLSALQTNQFVRQVVRPCLEAKGFLCELKSHPHKASPQGEERCDGDNSSGFQSHCQNIQFCTETETCIVDEVGSKDTSALNLTCSVFFSVFCSSLPIRIWNERLEKITAHKCCLHYSNNLKKGNHFYSCRCGNSLVSISQSLFFILLQCKNMTAGQTYDAGWWHVSACK